MQLTLFDMHNDNILKKIREADLNSMTPLEAMNFLNALKEDLG